MNRGITVQAKWWISLSRRNHDAVGLQSAYIFSLLLLLLFKFLYINAVCFAVSPHPNFLFLFPHHIFHKPLTSCKKQSLPLFFFTFPLDFFAIADSPSTESKNTQEFSKLYYIKRNYTSSILGQRLVNAITKKFHTLLKRGGRRKTLRCNCNLKNLKLHK